MNVTSADWWAELPGHTCAEGRLHLDRVIGVGGMGAVFAATDKKSGRVYAVKVLNPTQLTREMWRRFKDEGSKFARMRHVNLVRIHGPARIDELAHQCIVSEFIPGRDLFRIVEDDGPFECREALRIARSVATGLGAIHRQNFVHRDIKPENVMVRDEDGVVKVLDFGIAKDLDASTVITSVGGRIGTDGFAPEEQLEGRGIDGRADIFALGATLYEMISGREAFTDRNTTLFLQHIRDPVGSVSWTDFDPAVATLVKKMLARKRNRRPRDCDVLIAKIDDLLSELGEEP